jgi:8-oxo-dGTP pyrophosphatase MutT (NUDIX family)
MRRFSGGGREAGETPPPAPHRELVEEAGVRLVDGPELATYAVSAVPAFLDSDHDEQLRSVSR